MTIHYFFESLLSVTYINSVTHGEFYFVDYISRSAFTFVDTFSVDFRWKSEILMKLYIWSNSTDKYDNEAFIEYLKKLH